MDSAAPPVLRLVPRSLELSNIFMDAFITCPRAVETAVDILSSLGHDGAGDELLFVRQAAADYDNPPTALREDSKYADALMGYIVENEVVLLAFLEALPIYHFLQFCATSRYVRGLVLLNATEIYTAVAQEAALSIPRLHTTLPTTVEALPQLQHALLAAVVVEASGISAEDPSGDDCRAAVARGFSVLARSHKYV
jgi:hypothetical protein